MKPKFKVGDLIEVKLNGKYFTGKITDVWLATSVLEWAYKFEIVLDEPRLVNMITV